jgi:uncharacterized low-complexity protein
MSEKKVVKPVALAVGAALAGSFALTSSIASGKTVDSPFEIAPLESGYMLGTTGDNHKDHKEGEGKCGEGKCGEKKGEGKCGEGKCGEKEGEGKCGEKHGEGACGEKEEGEGKCGEGSCGAA